MKPAHAFSATPSIARKDDVNPLRIRVGRDVCPSPHSFQNKVFRVLWAVAYLIAFRSSPKICYGWRRAILRLFGAQIGRNVRIHPSVRIWAPWHLIVGAESSIARGADCYNVDLITIGEHATVSQEALLCTASHDVSDPHMRLTTAPITVASQAWVCARALVLPGVSIGEGAVVGAQSLVIHDVSPWMVVAGNPARNIKPRILVESKVDRSLP